MAIVNYLQLGATLFIPSTHKHLQAILCESKYPNLKSVLIDTEDSINEEDLFTGINAISGLLQNYKRTELLVFLRPRDANVLKELLKLQNIHQVDGFILPKFSLSNAKEYLEILKPYETFSLMPSIEGKELFNHQELNQLRDILLTNKHKITLVRFGLEDLLRQLSMKRSCEDSIFDFSSTSAVLGNFIATFKSSGFQISGGVYPCFKDKDGFIKDVKRDLKEGLFSKTVIHPNQVDLAHKLYKVSQKELSEAQEICKRQEAVFSLNNQMAEISTMIPYSTDILKRAEVYGVIND